MANTHWVPIWCSFAPFRTRQLASMYKLRSVHFYMSLLLVCASEKFLNVVHQDHSVSLFVLNVAILSARENFDNRQAIRDTWLQHLHVVNKYDFPFKLNVHFVLGDQPCLVHPLNREDLYECVPKLPLQPKFPEQTIMSFFELKAKAMPNSRIQTQFYSGFSFKVCAWIW